MSESRRISSSRLLADAAQSIPRTISQSGLDGSRRVELGIGPMRIINRVGGIVVGIGVGVGVGVMVVVVVVFVVIVMMIFTVHG